MTYFKTASTAVAHAILEAQELGYIIDQQDFENQVTFGGTSGRLRPHTGEYKSLSLGLVSRKGNPCRKALQIHLYGMESGDVELTHYIF